MTRLKFNEVPYRKDITIHVFMEKEFNQIIYSCVANSRRWAIELFQAQFPDLESANKRLAECEIYRADLSGNNFEIANND